MKKSYKKIFSLLCIFLMVFLVSCKKEDQKSAEISSEKVNEKNEKEPIRVGLLSIDDVLPLVVAKNEKLFEKEGLDVEVFPFKSSIDQSKAMEAGQLDIVMNDMIVQSLMKKGGLDTKILSFAFGANVKEGRFVVVSSPNSNIEKPEDLYGKKVAISENTMMDYLMNQYEKNLKLDSQKINKTNIPDLLLRMEMVLEGKEIDAAILPDPLASFAIKKGCHPVIDDTKLSENYSQSVIIAKDLYIENNKEDLKKFMKVYFDAMEKINNNPEDYKEIAIKNARVPEDLKNEYQTPKYTPYKIVSEEEFDRVSSWLVEKKLLDKPFSYDDLVTKEFVKEK